MYRVAVIRPGYSFEDPSGAGTKLMVFTVPAAYVVYDMFLTATALYFKTLDIMKGLCRAFA